MYIEPNSIIKIFHNVPLDNTYKNTLYFASKTAQNVYFHGDSTQGILKYTLASQSYQRVVKGSMRIAVKADSLYDCNYLAFQNTSFGQKWFYAFITSVEYVNNETSEITFEIDVMQTYMFDVEVKDCFVEREHSVTDIAGDNIQSEPIDFGDLICSEIIKTDWFSYYYAVIASAEPEHQPSLLPPGGLYGGLFSGIEYIAKEVDSPEEIIALTAFLDNLAEDNKQDAVVSIFMMPREFFPEGVDEETGRKYVAPTPVRKFFDVNKNNTLGNYTPRNKKLLTYPYNYMAVDCGNNGAIYRYEWFGDNLNCEFRLECSLSCNPEIALVPVRYNGTDSNKANITEKLVMNGFPQIAWTIDSYKAWLAQNSVSTAIEGATTVANVAISAVLPNPIKPLALAHNVSSIAQTAEKFRQAIIRPDQARGTSNGGVDVATRTKNFYFKRMVIQPQYAKIIDDYFDMYGYATNLIKKPNISSRPHWNYVKTRDCVIVGNAPADDISKITKIYDSGITFWKSAREVGNYSELDNRP